MATKQQTIDAERGDYLAAVLQLDPLLQAEQILRRRREHFGTPAPVDEQLASESTEFEVRLQRTEALNILRREFWSLDQVELDQALNSLNVVWFPELRVPVARLRIVARHRLQISEMLASAAKFTAMEREVLELLRRIWVSSARDALRLKEEYLERMVQCEALHAARRVNKFLQHSFPDLQSLEAGWIEPILPKNWLSKLAISAETEPFSWASDFWLWIMVGTVMLSNFVRFLSSLWRE